MCNLLIVNIAKSKNKVNKESADTLHMMMPENGGQNTSLALANSLQLLYHQLLSAFSKELPGRRRKIEEWWNSETFKMGFEVFLRLRKGKEERYRVLYAVSLWISNLVQGNWKCTEEEGISLTQLISTSEMRPVEFFDFTLQFLQAEGQEIVASSPGIDQTIEKCKLWYQELAKRLETTSSAHSPGQNWIQRLWSECQLESLAARGEQTEEIQLSVEEAAVEIKRFFSTSLLHCGIGVVKESCIAADNSASTGPRRRRTSSLVCINAEMPRFGTANAPIDQIGWHKYFFGLEQGEISPIQQQVITCLKEVCTNVLSDSKCAYKAIERVQLESSAEICEFTRLLEECFRKQLQFPVAEATFEAVEAAVTCKFFLQAATREGTLQHNLTEQLSLLPELNACSPMGKLLLHNWKVICIFQGSFALGNQAVQGIWDALVECLREYSNAEAIQVAGSFDVVLLCVVYSLCKIFDTDKTFKEIVQVYRQRVSLDAAVYLNVRLQDEMQEEKLSILDYYNEHFLPFATEAFQRMRGQIRQQTWKGKWAFPVATASAKVKRVRSHSVRITDNFCLAVSPNKPAVSVMERREESLMKSATNRRKASLTLSFEEAFVGPRKCQRKLEFE